MRLFSLLFSILSFSLLIGAIPLIVPEGEEFDLRDTIDDFLDELPVDSINEFFDTTKIQKRDDRTIIQILNLVNRSGVLWDLLDDVSDNPDRIEIGANLTASLIRRLGASSLDLSDLSSLTSVLNISAAARIVGRSGVVTSLLDGILLDESYRPTLVHLIERAALSGEDILYYLFNVVLSRRDLTKRASNGGSLQSFVGNILAAVLSSDFFTDSLEDITNALNDTQFLTYTVKRFLGDENYQNMTGEFLRDVYRTGVIRFDPGSLNISSILTTLLSDPTAIGSAIQRLTTMNLDVGKYEDALRDIIRDLENDGLFASLNSNIFPSTSTRSGSRTARREVEGIQGSSSSSSSLIMQVSASSQNSARHISTPFTRIVQTLFVGFLALVI